VVGVTKSHPVQKTKKKFDKLKNDAKANPSSCVCIRVALNENFKRKFNFCKK